MTKCESVCLFVCLYVCRLNDFTQKLRNVSTFTPLFPLEPYDDPYYRQDPAYDRGRPYDRLDDFDRRHDIGRDRYDDLYPDARPRDYRHGAHRDPASAVLTGREALLQSQSIDYKHGWREEERERRRHPPDRYDERDYPPEPVPPPKPKAEIVAISDLLDAPGRDTRPERVRPSPLRLGLHCQCLTQWTFPLITKILI